MTRRTRVVALAAALFAVLPAGTAHAAGTGQITSPAAGATLSSPTPVQVQVTGSTGGLLDRPDHVVKLRLAGPTSAAPWDGTNVVDASCTANCKDDSTWTTGDLVPATLAPFGSGASCNGGYTIQVQVDDGAWTGHGIRISRAPAAPTNVAVDAGVGEADVSWGATGDPDIVGYRVQRRPDGGSWTTVATVGAGTRSLNDDAVAPGDVEYRVTALRGDGQVGGAPVEPCTDSEPDLATASAPVAVRVASSTSDSSGSDSGSTSGPSRPSPSSSPTSGGTDTGSGGGTSDDSGSTDGGDTSGTADTNGGEQPSDTSSGDSTTVRRAGNRVAPPAALETTNGPAVSVPGASAADAPQVAEERYYGDGEEFTEELDFGDLGDVEAMPEGSLGTRTIRVPGALQSVLGEELDLRHLLTPIAAGLVMLAFALHLRRWTREGIEG